MLSDRVAYKKSVYLLTRTHGVQLLHNIVLSRIVRYVQSFCVQWNTPRWSVLYVHSLQALHVTT